MRYLEIRGNLVGIDGKTIFITIRKSQNGNFSLSDKVLTMLNKGYEALVNVEGKKILITKNSKILFKEIVKSKFEDGQDWMRYWFKMPVEVKEKQLEFV